ncbi:hypothetical protein D3C80_1699310 [compost metagenome]
MANKDIGGRRQRFCPRGTQQFLHAAAQHTDHQLHDAEVVKHRNQRGEEHDHRQDAQRKNKAAAAKDFKHLVGNQTAEDK